MPYPLIKPLLFKINPEAAHHLTIQALSTAGKSGMPLPYKTVQDPIELMGLTFANRVGLAAGMDKNAEAVLGLQAIGFGFLELGTVTPLAQDGNPKPRMFRLPEHQGVINRMGFNNDGLKSLLKRLAKARASGRVNVPIGVNIGKNKITATANAVDDYLICLKGAAELADYITINLSSPNTPGLRDLQFGEVLKNLLARLCEERENLRSRLSKNLPLLIKLAPDMAREDLISVANLSLELGVDGLILSNTTVDRIAVTGHRHAEQAGGLSGAPLFEPSTAALVSVAEYLNEIERQRLALIGVGGIDSAEKAVKKISAGADLVQIYTGMVYQGPSLVAKAAQAIKSKQQ